MRLRIRFILTVLCAGVLVFVMTGLFHDYLERRSTLNAAEQFVVAYMENGGRSACEASPSTWSLEDGPFRHGPMGLHDGPRPEPDASPPDEPGEGPKGRRPLDRRLYAYDSHFRSLNPQSPAVEAELKDALEGGAISAHRSLPLSLGTRPPFDEPHPPTDVRPPGEPRDPPLPGNAPGPEAGFRPDKPGFRPHPPFRPGPSQELLVRMPWQSGPCAVILMRFHDPSFEAAFSPHFPPITVWVAPVLVMLAIIWLSVGPLVRRIRLLTQEVRASADTHYTRSVPVKGRDEIAQLARAFEEARREILAHIAKQEERERNLRHFLENTTHDVSIPLTVLQGHLSDLSQQAQTNVFNPQTVRAAINETHYLAALINNLSVASKLEMGQPALQQEPVCLNDVVLRAVGRHRPIARQRGISLDHAVPEGEVSVLGDVTFIEQAVNNVIYNAIRYNREGGHVAVILEAEEARFLLHVIDDGPGIPEAERERLVERYYRGAANAERQRGKDGQGLGLHIAYQLALMHKWEFRLKESAYQGLEVEFAGPTL